MSSSPSLRFGLLLALTGCLGACGGGGSTDTPSAPSGAGALPAVQLTKNSYANYKTIGLRPQVLPSGGGNTIRAYGNFAGNNRLDLFRSVTTYNPSLPQSQATPARFEFFAQQPDGSYALSTAIMPQTNGCLHARKAIVADFNNDGKPDVFVACHGYDAPPYPGERNKIVLSQPNGTYAVSDAATDVGFNHGASAADLNGDGLPDVVVVSFFEADRAYVLLNDGTGHFVRDSTSRIPTAMRGGGPFFSVELVDVDEDGHLDLLVGGHEFDNAKTSVFLNPGTNVFTSVIATVLPPVANEGVVLDFTVTGTGPTRTLWVVRTSGGDGTFYASRVIQRIAYPSLTSSVVLNQRPAQWIPWLIPASINGANIIASDNAADGISIPQ